MRILSVRIRNLNSLSGDWTIRMDGPEYEAGGIFAITGPTGAGKSTILDAICLALYGRTPRLDKVTKSSNEIMSRQSAECMAEVCFRTLRGEFRCSWSQNRAGKRLSGNLQPPRHKLYDREGRAVAEKTTDVAAAVEELTGMDFQRFTQAMLLAQGRFASFLLADGDERAPLLEQITGTAVYSDISRAVHERTREEKLKLDALAEELAAHAVLSEEEEAALLREKGALQAEAASLSLREQALRADMARIEKAEALAREAKELESETEAWQREEETFAPGRARLLLARRAAGLAGTLEALDIRREEQKRDEEKSAALGGELPRLEEQERQAGLSLAGAVAALEENRRGVEKAREEWKRMREADTALAARRRDLEDFLAEVTSRRDALSRAAADRGREKAEHRREEAGLAALQEKAERLAADAALVETVGVLQERLALLEKEEALLAEEGKKLALGAASLEKKSAALAEGKNAALALQKRMTAADTALNEARKAFAALLSGKDLAFWRARQKELTARCAALEKAHEAALARESHLGRADALTEKERALALDVQKEEALLAAGREALAAARRAAALQEKIRSYEEERRALIEGSPCPLCGSLHHPFALETPALPPETDDVEQRQQALETLAAALAGHRRDAVHAAEARREAAEAAQKETQRLHGALCALSPVLEAALSPHPAASAAPAEAWENEILAALARKDAALPPLLKRLLEQSSPALAETSALLRTLDARQEAGLALAEEADRLRRECEAAQRAVQEKEAAFLSEKAGLDALAGETARRREEADKAGRALGLEVRRFGESGETTQDLRRAVAALLSRRDAYAALLEEKKRASLALAERLRLLAVAEQSLRAARQEWLSATLSRREREKALAAEEAARRALFGGRLADEEEEAAAKSLRAMEEDTEKRRKALEAASRALAESRSARAALVARMRQRASALQDMEKALSERLAAEGFADEAACKSALLAEEALERLVQTEQSLAERAAGLQARRLALEERMREDDDPIPSREETTQALEETARLREEALRRFGSLQERLNANSARKRQAELCRRKTAEQAALCRRWAALNELIGSADGKKFRNYAQELTFRRLILMANRQLAAMTDRYLLTPCRDEALTLNVIDRYQADAVRSSRNLSGGESFLVSLALARGLAQMAGRNVRVDSVFLDEGFGTLDEQALQTALDMLASLRQKGKMIGIISHVQAVRERVATQIRVTPAGNGKSRISGPGVSQTREGQEE